MLRSKNQRLRSAVREERPRVSKRGMLDQLFIWAFSGLVYPQIWEDPVVDMEALGLPLGDACDKRVITIASGGCNLMSYLGARPAGVVAVDLNPAHVALARLKLAAVQHLPNYEAFFRFFGHADEKANVHAYDRYIAPHLDRDTRAYWEARRPFRRRIDRFSRNFYRHGLLGRFIGLAHVVSRLYGRDPKRMLTAKNQEQQRWLFETQFGPLFDSPFIKWLCNNPVSLYGLGIPPAQYVHLSGGRPMNEVLRERLETLACDFPLSENYFAWQAFGRSYDVEERIAVPPYLREEYYDAVRESARDVQVYHLSMTEYLNVEEEDSFDGYLMLDAQDWMTPAQLTDLWTTFTRTARPGGRVVFRTAGEDSPLEGALPEEILARWASYPDWGQELCRRDRSSIYGGLHIYEFKG